MTYVVPPIASSAGNRDIFDPDKVDLAGNTRPSPSVERIRDLIADKTDDTIDFLCLLWDLNPNQNNPIRLENERGVWTCSFKPAPKAEAVSDR